MYDTAKVNATIETVKRRNRRQVKEAAGLTPNMISAIIRKYGYPRQGRRPEHQREMAIGVAVAVGFKILLRYDDLVRARWNDGYCEVLETHVRFYLDGRKNNQYCPTIHSAACFLEPLQAWSRPLLVHPVTG